MSRTLRARYDYRFDGEARLVILDEYSTAMHAGKTISVPSAWLPVSAGVGTILTAREIAPATVKFGVARLQVDVQGELDDLNDEDDGAELAAGLEAAGLPAEDLTE